MARKLAEAALRNWPMHPITEAQEWKDTFTVTNYDPVNHPAHYNSHPSGVECITITRHMNFNIGNAVKYLWRAGLKGSTIEDLKKAVWYINDEIKRLEKKL